MAARKSGYLKGGAEYAELDEGHGDGRRAEQRCGGGLELGDGGGRRMERVTQWSKFKS